MNTLNEAIKYGGYEIQSVLINLHKRQYIDNGYGICNTIEIDIVFDVLEDEIKSITIDGDTIEQLQVKQNSCMMICDYQKRHDGCGYGDCRYGIEDDIDENKEYHSDCISCELLSMMIGYAEMIETSGW